MVVNFVVSVISLKPYKHLFFDCHYARFLWHAVYWVFGIAPPTSVSHLLGGWSKWGSASTTFLYLQEHRAYVGQFGSQEMISFLTNAKTNFFYRYFSRGY